MNKMDKKLTPKEIDYAKNMNVAPAIPEDQLDEKAAIEFGEDYENKGNDITKSTKKNTKQ
ncbi:MAG TPA: hypothetical protein VHY08_09350 [Bacillota bacterium]|nr:hypothetical protein [Bacillota bacterium]